MTNFEHIVLSRVADCLGVSINERFMEFCYGTLFIKNFTDEEAARVLNNLSYLYKVEMNRCGTEFAYDFVA